MRGGIARIREPAAVGTICSASDEAIQKFSGAADAWRPLTLRMTWQVRQAIVTHHLCRLFDDLFVKCEMFITEALRTGVVG